MLTLIRTDFKETGIFGKLLRKDGELIAYTLEHSLPKDKKGKYYAKTAPGTYVCRRSKWYRKPGEADDVETYEIMEVPGHTRILFHFGNYESDTQGCILLGLKRYKDMVTHSRVAFNQFMDLVGHKDSFFLTIEEHR